MTNDGLFVGLELCIKKGWEFVIDGEKEAFAYDLFCLIVNILIKCKS